ncbi:MAG: hypothetical protein AAB443_04260 [Patescibacteria group bacterium]
MAKIVYVCSGTCQAEVTEEQYKNGLTKCGANVCSMKGHEFEKRLKCEECGALYKEGEAHKHS